MNENESFIEINVCETKEKSFFVSLEVGIGCEVYNDISVYMSKERLMCFRDSIRNLLIDLSDLICKKELLDRDAKTTS
jgi:hypothetical protein